MLVETSRKSQSSQPYGRKCVKLTRCCRTCYFLCSCFNSCIQGCCSCLKSCWRECFEPCVAIFRDCRYVYATEIAVVRTPALSGCCWRPSVHTNRFDAIFGATIIFSLFLGGLLTLATRRLQEAPHGWNHHMTVLLAFAISTSVLILIHMCCICGSNITRQHLWGIFRGFVNCHNGLYFYMVLATLSVGVGAFFNWIWFHMSLDVADNDNGNGEAKKYATLGAVGFGLILLFLIIFSILCHFCIFLAKKWTVAYQQAVALEVYYPRDILTHTDLPLGICQIIYEFTLPVKINSNQVAHIDDHNPAANLANQDVVYFHV